MDNFITEIHGIKSKSKLYHEVGTNYFYKKNKISSGKYYLNCHLQGCNAKLIVMDTGKTLKGSHNHLASTEMGNEILFLGRIKKRCEETTEGLRNIYDSEMSK